MACCKPFDTSAEAGVAAHLTGSLSISLPGFSTRVAAINRAEEFDAKGTGYE
jgi:hypothetical protein